jgi:cytochrome c oxidase assembly protein subunit 15
VNATGSSASHVWLARYAKLVVAATFALLVIGGHTTTSGAGMAFPDWPLSHGSINPNGWWENLMQRLEHGHRLTAETTALLIAMLCAWIWRSKWSIPVAAGVSVVLAIGARLAGAPAGIIAHAGLWSAVVVFAAFVLSQAGRRDHPHSATARWLAFAAFLGVCAQAVMGGLRVTTETAGDANAATLFRILHGCFAQFELCLLVAIATILSPVWRRLGVAEGDRGTARLAWITTGFVYLQLIVGATMRHLGAGLAIPTFPAAAADGGWMPATHDALTSLNFVHTRVGALLVALAVGALVFRALNGAGHDSGIIGPAFLLLAATTAQVLMGMLVIWKMRPPILTTLHVVNGAAVLATTVLLATRASRKADWRTHVSRRISGPRLQEARA